MPRRRTTKTGTGKGRRPRSTAQGPKHGNEPWTKDQTTYLMDQRDMGTAHGLIARILGRTGQACRLHAMQTSKRIEAAKGLLDSAKADEPHDQRAQAAQTAQAGKLKRGVQTGKSHRAVRGGKSKRAVPKLRDAPPSQSTSMWSSEENDAAMALTSMSSADATPEMAPATLLRVRSARFPAWVPPHRAGAAPLSRAEGKRKCSMLPPPPDGRHDSFDFSISSAPKTSAAQLPSRGSSARSSYGEMTLGARYQAYRATDVDEYMLERIEGRERPFRPDRRASFLSHDWFQELHHVESFKLAPLLPRQYDSVQRQRHANVMGSR